jgi:hypothetical protein
MLNEMKPNISLTLGLVAGNEGVCLFIRRVSSALCASRCIDILVTHLFIPSCNVGLHYIQPNQAASFTL